MAISELLDIQELQKLQDSFVRMAGVNAMLVDSEGGAVLRSSDQKGTDALLSLSEGKERRAMSPHRKLCQENRITKQVAVTTSPRTGLTTGAVPLLLGNQYLGSWVVGPLIRTDADLGIIRQSMLENGMNDAEAQHLLDALPHLDQAGMDSLFFFLESMSAYFLRAAQANDEMSRNNRELSEMLERLDSSQQMLSTLTNSADVGMYVLDFFTGEVLQGNESFARDIGKPLDELIGMKCWECVGEDSDTFCPDCPHSELLNKRGRPGEPLVWERYDEESGCWRRVTHQAIHWVDGRLAHMVTFLDITSNKTMEEQLKNYAFYDRILGLPNVLKLTQDMLDWDKEKHVYAICLNIISLRMINDMYGREAGDVLLRSVCQWLEKQGVAGARIYRIDGHEFAFVTQGLDKSVVLELAEIVRKRFDEAWALGLGSQEIHVFCDVAVGVVNINGRYTNTENLVTIVERTLDKAMRDGKVVVYGEKLNREYKEQLKLELSLKNCVKNGMEGFEVYYQPIIDPATGCWCSLEALCRWTSPECGVVTPVVFIHKAEQLGLITIIGKWVLKTAVEQCKKWGLDRYEAFILDVNLSPAQVTDDELAQTVLDTLAEHKFPGNKLSLEITESVEMVFNDMTMGTIERLRQAGILMALDDFGTGYSSFNNLRNMPVSLLKTERAFLENIEKDSYLQNLFHVMAELAHAADMKIIAEGVESEEQMHILLQNGVDFMQGYLFSVPLSAELLGQNLDKFHVSSIPSPAGAVSVPLTLDELARCAQSKLSPQLLRLLGECSHILMTDHMTGYRVEDALRLVGNYFRISRCTVYWDSEGDDLHKGEEWLAGHCDPAPERLSRTGALPHCRLLRDLEQHGIVRADVEDADIAGDAKCSLMLPMYGEGGALLGVVCFDDCVYYRDWKPDELLLLYSFSNTVGAAGWRHSQALEGAF